MKYIINRLYCKTVRIICFYLCFLLLFGACSPNTGNKADEDEREETSDEIATFTDQSRGETLTGTITRVSDGDTVILLDSKKKKHRVRLNGIDCPELKQRYGSDATRFVEKLCKDKAVTVEVVGRDQYKRVLGVLISGGKNVNEELLRNGLAWQYKHNKNPKYTTLSDEAKRMKLNIWSEDSPIAPWDWRNKQNQ